MRLLKEVGLVLDEHQALVLDGALGESDETYRRPDGSVANRWAASETAVVQPRQNGKTILLAARAIAGLFYMREKLILWTAHEFKTAREGFLTVRDLIESTDFLRERVKAVRVAAGEEGIETWDGNRLRFLARSRGSGRGFSADCLLLDEAYALTDDQMGAILPTLSARPNPQTWFASSAPLLESEVLRRVCRRGRAGNAGSLAYFEWCADEDVEPDDRTAWAAANPAYPTRIDDEAIFRELGTLGVEAFLRERLGIWPEDGVDEVIPEVVWKAARDDTSQIIDPVCFAVDATPGRDYATIAVAGRRADGLTHVELVDGRSGMGWVPARLAELVAGNTTCAVMLDPGGPAGAFLPALTELEVTTKCQCHGDLDVQTVSTREVAQACGALYDGFVEGRYKHLGQEELDGAVAGAVKRPLLDAWALDRKNSARNISPLVAVTLAAYGFSIHGPTPDYDVMDSVF